MTTPASSRTRAALRTAAITLVLIVGSAATVAACAFVSPVLGVVVAVATVMALIGVGELLSRRGGETGGNFADAEQATTKLRAVQR